MKKQSEVRRQKPEERASISDTLSAGIQMENVAIGEAKKRFSELVERASSGQKIGLTRRGKLVEMIVPAPPQESLEQIFRNLDEIRKRSKKLPKGVTVKDLIEDGRA